MFCNLRISINVYGNDKCKFRKPAYIMKEKVENLSSKMERLEWRRNKVLELSGQGHGKPEIARILQVGLATVNRDMSYLRQQAKTKIKRYIDERGTAAMCKYNN